MLSTAEDAERRGTTPRDRPDEIPSERGTVDTGGVVVHERQQPQIWFLTGSQHLYGPDTLAQVAEQSRTVRDLLTQSGELPAEVVWKPVLTDSAAIRASLAEANADPACVGVIAWMHTF